MVGPRARAAVLLLCLLAGDEAARVQRRAASAGAAVEALNASAGLLEEGCRFDEAGDSRALALHRGAWASEAQELGPDDYWSAENALARCRAATTWRTVKVFVGVPIVLVVGELMLSFAVLSPAYTALLDPVFSAVTPYMAGLTDAGAGFFPPLFSYAMSQPLYLAKGALSAIFGLMAGVYYVGGFLIAWTLPAAAYVAPVVVAMEGARRLVQPTVDAALRLAGYSSKSPSCCCAPEKAPSEESCALVSSTVYERCPFMWVHDPTYCAAPEILQYSAEQTLGGCRCKNSTHCGSNRPYRGHAWCEVGGRCGRSYHSLWRWDYCRVDGRPLQFAVGNSTAPNDALATFVPNQFGNKALPWSPGDVFTLGTWVDAGRGLTTAKQSFFRRSECFAGTPVETLSACARLCLEEGAPNARTMGNLSTQIYKCVAFAYHRQLHTCVRLPDFAADAKFTPYLREWGGDGWQNFVSKYHGRNPSAVCPADTLVDIQRSGYIVVRDKNNGHLYVQCENKGDVQKVSCLQQECEHKSSWCFVKNRCRSGTPVWLGGCKRLRDAQALSCAGEHGAVVPDSGADQRADFWDAENALNRCSRASAIRRLKVMTYAPLLLAAGELATMSLMQQGIYSELVGRVFSNTFQPIGRYMFDASGWVLHPFSWVMAAIPSSLQLAQLAWGAVIGAFAAVYVLGGLVLAVTPSAAAILTPVIVATGAAQRLTEVTMDVVAGLVGYGPKHPFCCCSESNATVLDDGRSRACAVTLARSGLFAWRCPAGFFHDASQCSVPEVVRYSDQQTVAGCRCANFTDCGTNPPYHGHAWCHASGPRGCGHRPGGVGAAWDYCRLDGKPLDYAAGASSERSDALATFVPNEFSRVDLLGPGNPFRLGTWTDAERALTTARPSTRSSRRCFAALPVETLGACAQSCLDAGAPDARTMADRTEKTAYPCAAFSYNRGLNLCVRLPAFAADAKYTPMLRQWGGDGWQNFVSKYYGRSLESSCPAMTLLHIRDSGYAVARDKNNGHLYLRCAGNSTGATQKASCIRDECRGNRGLPWCFVANRCGGAFSPCRKTDDQDPLKC